VYVGQVFFRAGLTKIQDWETTLLLFTEEYKTPVLSPTLAAYSGTAGELVLPVLLVLGLGGRFAALGLFVVNLMAVLSLNNMTEPALQLHIFWGSLLAMLALWGPGSWSLERFLLIP
jgi:putative oxidoreductase